MCVTSTGVCYEYVYGALMMMYIVRKLKQFTNKYNRSVPLHTHERSIRQGDG